MKQFLLGLLPVFMLGCATVSNEIVIDATPEQVWNVLIETEKYPEWNPVMTKVSGRHEIGKELVFTIAGMGDKPIDMRAIAFKIEDQKYLEQKGGTWGMMTFHHQYILEKVDKGTKVTQREGYSGLGLLFWDHTMMNQIYQNSNEALKKRVESLK